MAPFRSCPAATRGAIGALAATLLGCPYHHATLDAALADPGPASGSILLVAVGPKTILPG
ncbi:hypothetical protein OG689_42120 [Kitasatospora sp. NBC_00240]|uniref:hypothetical protein n=1 Tax=Kitasatospora sp. NBC_00240 TaxID=2903567 RepID=UPI002251CC58|nr:hypothetical protein [Kitasatospora sp. NBC_00240]MCX5215754.1 hypothetical protein [Kitasatospora sp. NBC_00240]